MYLKTQGLVLRTTEYKETDLILTVLTREHGLMTLKARGVRRNASRLKSACQLFCFSEFTALSRMGYYSLTEAEPLQQFRRVREDIELLALASYFAQLAEVLSQQDAPDGALLSLILNALYALSELGKPQRLVKAVFELRAMCEAGFSPELSGCAVCGREEPEYFFVSEGVLRCAGCAGGTGLRLPVPAGTLAAMRYIVSCEPRRLFSFSVSDEALRRLCDVSETYLLTQLERGFPTLDFYKSLMNPMR